VTTPPRELYLFHGTFAVTAAVVVYIGQDRIGWWIALLTASYSAGVVGLALRHRDRVLLRLWWFGAVLSVWQVLPDWFLVEGLGTLTFPPDGFPDVGPVTLHMAWMWTIPTVIVVLIGMAVEERRGRGAGALAAGLAGFVIYVSAEVLLPTLGIWQARNVHHLGTVAIYIVPAQVLLSVVTYEAFLTVRDRSPWAAIPASLLVSMVYTGAAATSWLVVERIATA
jgi:hypothetical protein